MTKSESKYLNTARLMDEALLQLLDKKEFAYITVKEVCKKAGVNRSTFYLHYESMTDLLSESIGYLKEELLERYGKEPRIDIESSSLDELFLLSQEYTIPYLEFLKEHKKAFMAAVSQPNVFGVDATYQRMYRKLFAPILDRYNVPKEEQPYRMNYYMNGIHAMIIEWLKAGCKDDISFLADLIVKLVKP